MPVLLGCGFTRRVRPVGIRGEGEGEEGGEGKMAVLVVAVSVGDRKVVIKEVFLVGFFFPSSSFKSL